MKYKHFKQALLFKVDSEKNYLNRTQDRFSKTKKSYPQSKRYDFLFLTDYSKAPAKPRLPHYIH